LPRLPRAFLGFANGFLCCDAIPDGKTLILFPELLGANDYAALFLRHQPNDVSSPKKSKARRDLSDSLPALLILRMSFAPTPVPSEDML
jgi:hypothetical protein